MIEVIDLKKVFDNGFEALKSVNFTIEQGDLVCLLGPSGCGKSTILNLIAGLLHPSDGDIQFRQQSVVKTAPKDRNIGFVFQNYALYPHMTACSFDAILNVHLLSRSTSLYIIVRFRLCPQ